MRLLEKKVAIVTGAGAGIGKATAMLFAKEGATVYAADIKGLEWIDSKTFEGECIKPIQLDICDFIVLNLDIHLHDISAERISYFAYSVCRDLSLSHV